MPLVDRLCCKKVPLRCCYDRRFYATRETATDMRDGRTFQVIVINGEVYTSNEKDLRTKIGETPYRIN